MRFTGQSLLGVLAVLATSDSITQNATGFSRSFVKRPRPGELPIASLSD